MHRFCRHPLGRPGVPGEKILVLGESWYGDWGTEFNSDQAYVAAYLEGKLRDGMYTKMANACGMDKVTFWRSILFTNFVTWAGSYRTDRPTTKMYKDAVPRLIELLQKFKPAGVWILGKEQSYFSAPVVFEFRIPYVSHPGRLHR